MTGTLTYSSENKLSIGKINDPEVNVVRKQPAGLSITISPSPAET